MAGARISLAQYRLTNKIDIPESFFENFSKDFVQPPLIRPYVCMYDSPQKFSAPTEPNPTPFGRYLLTELKHRMLVVAANSVRQKF
jgi:hypothetical protein